MAAFTITKAEDSNPSNRQSQRFTFADENVSADVLRRAAAVFLKEDLTDDSIDVVADIATCSVDGFTYTLVKH